jgi:hypothetical protein
MHSVGSKIHRSAAQSCPTQRPPIHLGLSVDELLTRRARFSLGGSPCWIQCGIYGEQSGSATFFSFSVHFAFLPAINIPTNLHSHTLSEVGKICFLKTPVPCDTGVSPTYKYNETLSIELPFRDTSSPSWLPCVSWFPCVCKRMLRRFPRHQVATICFQCSPPDLNFLDLYFIFMCVHYNHCHRVTARLQLNILLILSLSSSSLSEPMYIQVQSWYRVQF